MAIESVENAVMRLYEDASLTDDLTDDAAGILQKWGEALLRQLAERHTEEEPFEEDFKVLRKLIKSISRFTWQRQDMPPEGIQEYMAERIIKRMQELGGTVYPEQVRIYMEKQSTLDEQAHVQILTELYKVEKWQKEDKSNQDFPGLFQ